MTRKTIFASAMPTARLWLLAALSFLAVAAWSPPSSAETAPGTTVQATSQNRQDQAPSPTDWGSLVVEEGAAKKIIEEHTPKLENWNAQIDAAAELIKDDATPDTTLRELPARLETVRDEIGPFMEKVQPKLDDTRATLDKLGPKPKKGAPEEASDLAKKRDNLGKEVAAYDGLIKQAAALLLRADQLIDQGNAKRRERFAKGLLSPVGDFYASSFWDYSLDSAPWRIKRAALALTSWLGDVRDKGSWRIAMLFALPVAAALLLAWLLRRVVRPTGPGATAGPRPDMTARGAHATLAAFRAALPFLAAFAVFYGCAHLFGELTPTGESFLSNTVLVLAGAAFLLSIVWNVFAPRDTSFQLVRMERASARRLALLLSLLILVWTCDQILTETDAILFTPYALTVLRSTVVAALVVLLLAALLLVRPGMVEPNRQGSFGGWPAAVPVAVALLSGSILVAGALGYVSLARFAGTQIVATGGIVFLMFLLHLAAEHMSTSVITPDSTSKYAAVLQEGQHLSPLRMLGLIGGILLDIVILIVGVPLILLQWGVDRAEVQSWIKTAFFGFQVGGLTISIQSILFGLLVFGVGLVVTRMVQRWFLRRSGIGRRSDNGLRDSVKTGLGYLGFILSGLAAASYLGVNFANLAIVAGALSVGIGFGLQSIFNNFVSGLILLVERPIKVGDWIVAGPDQGRVKKISVRSTEIETMHRESVIVPNSALISGTVKNWMHSDRTCRIDIPVGVSYKSDVKTVREILLQVADKHAEVMRDPEPFVFFEGFGESSVDFQLRVHLGNVDRRVHVVSDLRFAIWEAFHEARIEIPFPQRDLNIKDIDQLQALMSKAPRAEGIDRPGLRGPVVFPSQPGSVPHPQENPLLPGVLAGPSK